MPGSLWQLLWRRSNPKGPKGRLAQLKAAERCPTRLSSSDAPEGLLDVPWVRATASNVLELGS
eukprot:9566394-Alexandrium_andersonii.AAC.1